MTCKEAIEKGLCLGCGLGIENNNADNCEYREKSRLDICKRIIEEYSGIQQKLWK